MLQSDNEEPVSNDSSDSEPRVVLDFKKRRPRTKFTAEQLDQLEKAFQRKRNPDDDTMTTLAEHLNLTLLKVKVWFSNQRAKHRRKERNTEHNTEGDGRLNWLSTYAPYIEYTTSTATPARGN